MTEAEIISQIEIEYDACTSDAQAILEAALLNCKGDLAKAAAEVLGAS